MINSVVSAVLNGPLGFKTEQSANVELFFFQGKMQNKNRKKILQTKTCDYPEQVTDQCTICER
jgi:hypothetical protein